MPTSRKKPHMGVSGNMRTFRDSNMISRVHNQNASVFIVNIIFIIVGNKQNHCPESFRFECIGCPMVRIRKQNKKM
jgi:hypothetical protein